MGPEWAGTGLGNRLLESPAAVVPANPVTARVIEILRMLSAINRPDAVAGMFGWDPDPVGHSQSRGIACAVRLGPAGVPTCAAAAAVTLDAAGNPRIDIVVQGNSGGRSTVLPIDAGSSLSVGVRAADRIDVGLPVAGPATVTHGSSGDSVRIGLSRAASGSAGVGPGIDLGAPPVAVGGNITTVRRLIADLTDTVDAVGDLLLAESVHHIVGGNPLRAGLAAETATRCTLPDDFEVIATPRSASTVSYTFAGLSSNILAANSDWSNARGLAQLEPALEQWCRTRLGRAARWRFDARRADGSPASVQLDQLGLGALEAVRTATAGPESPFAKRLLDAAGPEVVGLADGPAGVGRYQEFTTLAEALRSAMAAGAPLLASHLDPVVDAWEPADLDELAQRVGGWFTLVRNASDALTAAIAQDPPAVDAVVRQLDVLMGAGVIFDHPASDPQSVVATGRSVLDSIAVAEVPGRPAPPPSGKDRSSASTIEWLAKLTRPLHALIGDGLPLLPVLRLATTPLAELFAPAHRPRGAGPDEVADWIRDLGRVRPRVASADQALCGAELLAATGASSYTVTQAPLAANQLWIAGDAGSARSSCVIAADGAINVDNITGLVFDSWSEVLPRPGPNPGTADEIAGIAFHTARPDARPPQSLLLAVPPDTDRGWRAEDVQAVVAETFELAQVRGLDLTDLPELRGPLPPEIKGRGVDLLPLFFGAQ